MITSHSRYQAPRQNEALCRSGVTQHTILPCSSHLLNTLSNKALWSRTSEQDGFDEKLEKLRAQSI